MDNHLFSIKAGVRGDTSSCLQFHSITTTVNQLNKRSFVQLRKWIIGHRSRTLHSSAYTLTPGCREVSLVKMSGNMSLTDEETSGQHPGVMEVPCSDGCVGTLDPPATPETPRPSYSGPVQACVYQSVSLYEMRLLFVVAGSIRFLFYITVFASVSLTYPII